MIRITIGIGSAVERAEGEREFVKRLNCILQGQMISYSYMRRNKRYAKEEEWITTIV